jgi:hypothetical protein
MQTQQPLLSPVAQKIALFAAATPSLKDLFAHQANILIATGLSTEKEIDLAAKHVPQSSPFIFIPENRPSVSEMQRLMLHMANSYEMATGRVDLNHPIHDTVEVPEGGYFLTDYDETVEACKVSAAECENVLVDRGRLPLTATEIGFRLLYFPHALDDVQFAATGSCIHKEEDDHVPVFFLINGTRTLALGSFARRHHSKFTTFPSCRERVACCRTH